MAWFVGMIIAVGTATLGVLLTRIERVRIQAPAGVASDAPAEPVVSAGPLRG